MFGTAIAAASMLGACTSRSSASRVPPSAEFLFAAGDSTYWVRSSAEGMRVRSAPILLTQADGKFYEVFVSDDGVDYADASFSTARIWSREVMSTDSLLLFSDSAIMQEASAWKRRNPTAAPIDADDEEATGDPRSVAHEDIEIVDVHGPWLTFRQVLNVDIDGGAPHRHVGRRAVVDVRTGKLATLNAMFGDAEATRVVAAGRASLVQLIDSIRKTGDNRAELARETLESFQFDAASFGLSDVDRAPAVAFLVPGSNSDGEALAIYLPPLAVAPPEWWSAVRPTLPEWAKDSSRVKWSRLSYDVAARPSPDGESLALVLIGKPGLRPREWPIATVVTPAYQLIPLDAPPLVPTVRSALAKAFDASSAIDGLVQRASLHSAPWPTRNRRPVRRRLPPIRTRRSAFRTFAATSLHSSR